MDLAGTAASPRAIIIADKSAAEDLEDLKVLGLQGLSFLRFAAVIALARTK
jgi:hypothetical protein